MPKLELDPDHSLSWRETPWDARVFLMPTWEIQTFEARTQAGGEELLRQFETQARETHVGLVFTRLLADKALHKRLLGDAGFQHVETSLSVSHKQIQRTDWAKLSRPLPGLEPATDQDWPGLQRLLSESFDHGRFHEDPWLTPGLAQQRYVRWLDDLRTKEISVWRHHNQVQGVHIQAVTGSSAELILTGVARPVSMLAMPLWVTALTRLKERGIVDCHTLVSAANTGVINLYARLGFHFDNTLFGYHKLYKY